MLKKERQAYILHRLDIHNKVVNTKLCEDIGVSEDTIRRDLEELDRAGKLIKVHGGALSNSFNHIHFDTVPVYSLQQKEKIAEKAIRLIKDNMYVLTSGGTTILEMAKRLPHQLKATFITGSIPVLNAYIQHPNLNVIVVGDRVNKNAKITVGASAIAKIREVNADLCILGTNAIDLRRGITDNDWEVVELKRAMIEASTKTVCLTIAEKLNSFEALQVCELKRIDYLITELSPDDKLLQPYVKAGVTVL
ncbi:DeoR family transcriptional regulator [Niabella ginsenosidivorans]|uniref:DeoR family transcriptional regulator n=1 Tax=Niabella ginsenosidivorans TaxID=1176587 RepID=A0A1A9HZW2_9BACT|nr:DeoR/GlpR family DNA-binding transcription regulator [Niabella ginsenosidivorans]ANH79962.1 DeoR family transcriptional regulator [Niabella ginsenosidivorans]